MATHDKFISPWLCAHLRSIPGQNVHYQGFANFTQKPSIMSTILPDQQLMHLGTWHHASLPLTAQAIWDGQAMLATNGSVKDNKAIYAWIVSNTNDQITLDIQGSGILPLSAQYTKHASKWPEAAALYAA